MKKEILRKIICFIYLICCLLVALTPNVIKLNSKKDSDETTELEYATEAEIAEYKNDFEQFNKSVLSKRSGLTSLIAMKDGKVFFEEYYNGSNEKQCFEIHSCTKTIIAILTGIAIDDGIIKDEYQPFLSLFDGLDVPKVTDGMEQISIRNFLDMSSGINWDKYAASVKIKLSIVKNGLEYGRCLLPSASISYGAGEYFNYNSNESRALMAMLAYRSQKEDIDFLKEKLFDPLEIKNFYWPLNDSGLLPGGKDVFLTSRGLAKIGQLLLDQGFYKGKKIVSPEWVEKMFITQVEGIPAEDIEPSDEMNYGSYLWHSEYKGTPMIFAYGRGGQYIFMFPEKKICVVTSAIDKGRKNSFRDLAYGVMDIFQGEFEGE